MMKRDDRNATTVFYNAMVGAPIWKLPLPRDRGFPGVCDFPKTRKPVHTVKQGGRSALRRRRRRRECAHRVSGSCRHHYYHYR
jgi:hypothetical protein